MSDTRPFSELRPTVMRDFFPPEGRKLELIKVPFSGGSVKIAGKPPKEASATLSINLERVARPNPAHRPHRSHLPQNDWVRRASQQHTAYRPSPPPALLQPRTPSQGVFSRPQLGIVGPPTGAPQLRRPTHWARPTSYPVKHPKTLHDHSRNLQTLLQSAAAAVARANPHLNSGFRLGAPTPPSPRIIHRR